MTTLTIAQLFATFLAIQALPIADRGPQVTGDLRAMQGQWAVDRAEDAWGTVLPAYQGQLRHTLRGSLVSYSIQGHDAEDTIRLDETQKPKRMTITDSNGRTGRCVYQLEGDRLTVIVVGSTEEWPTEFKPAPEGLILIYRRESR